MQKIPTTLLVVALALFDREGRVLLQQRLPGKHHGGLWEFPGGKVEPHEKPRAALLREIAEELEIALDPAQLQPGPFADEGAESGIVLILYRSHEPVGEPVACDGQAFGWFSPPEAADLPLAPMDRELMSRLTG